MADLGELDVLIIGGGMGGCIVATGLAEHGVHPETGQCMVGSQSPGQDHSGGTTGLKRFDDRILGQNVGHRGHFRLDLN